MKKLNVFIMAIAMLVSGSAWGELHEPQTADDQASIAVTGQTTLYGTLAEAIAGAPTDGTEAIITMLKDVELSAGLTIALKKVITLELNGKNIGYVSTEAANSALFTNMGTLTIQDNTDVSFDGTGTGRIASSATQPDLGGIPGYASNTILNRGQIWLKSGVIESSTKKTDAQAAYAVDNDMRGGSSMSEVKLKVTGGWIKSFGSKAIRMYILASPKISVNLENCKITSIWVQDGTSADDEGEIIATNVEFEKSIAIGYYTPHTTKFTLNLNNCSYKTLNYEELDPNAGSNSISITNNANGQFYMTNPKKILTNGIFSFSGEFALGWCYVNDDPYYAPWYGSDVWKSKGVRIDYNAKSGNWYKGYLSPKAHLHGFYDYIVDGFGLKCLDAATRTYEVVPLTKTNPNPPTPESAELGNPWHVGTTWKVGGTTTDVPVEDNAVMIDHNVYVETGSESAVANSIIIEKGNTLTIQSGAQLNVGNAGVKFNGTTSKIIVEAGATLTVGDNGVIGNAEQNIIIKASETEQGAFMLNPGVTINTQPEATVSLFTKSHQISSKPEYIWQRFAIPVTKLAASPTNDFGGDDEIFPGSGSGFITGVFKWDEKNSKWEMLSQWTETEPFRGFQLANNFKYEDGQDKAGITYTFEGQLVGNHNESFKFVKEGFHFFGNSYTADINIEKFLVDVALNEKLDAAVYIYDPYGDNFKTLTSVTAKYGLVKYEDPAKTAIKDIKSMQAFIMNANTVGAGTANVNYESAIWGNPKYSLVKGTAAPQEKEALTMDMATIKVKANNGQADEVHMFQAENFAAAFENGADAKKYIYESGINLYANTAAGQLSDIATDNLDQTLLSFKSGKDTEYTITFSNLNGEVFTLIDQVTNVQVSMIEGASYTFVQNANTTSENRFKVVGGKKIVTGLENAANQVSVNKLIENDQVVIVKDGVRYNVLGSQVEK